MAYTQANITTNSTNGIISRLQSSVGRKNLLNLKVLTEDSSDFSPYFFNVIRKPSELKLGGNIFEFAPPRNRFRLNSEILFEVVDNQNNVLPYEILPKREGNPNIRICIFIYDTTPDGPAIITLVGESLLDECGCPVPEEWKDKPNIRWTCQSPVRTDDVSDIIEYDTAPIVTVSETKVPWTYQTYEDVYNINPGAPGTPYTVTGSYNPTYNSEPTGSGTGKFTYNRDIEPNPATGQVGEGTIQVYFGNLRFSSSMVGGFLYVSGGPNHINSAVPNPHPPTTNFFAYYATISAVLSSTTAKVQPAYGGGFQYELGNYYPRTFDAKQGARLSWTETSNSIAFTDPTAETSTLTKVERTIEQHTSYADISIVGLKPICGVATDVEVFVRSNRLEGPLTKLTEFPIEGNNLNITSSRTEKGNDTPFLNEGVFESLADINRKFQSGGSGGPLGLEATIGFNNAALLNSMHIRLSGNAAANLEFEKEENFIFARQKTSGIGSPSNQNFIKGGNYYVEFDAVGDISTNNSSLTIMPEVDIFISGSGIPPTKQTPALEKDLGQFIGTIKNTGTRQRFMGNSFEFKAEVTGKGYLVFVVRQGKWYFSNIQIKTAPGSPAITGRTPYETRALIPMPAITKHNDEYSFEFRYKNKNTVANKVSTLQAGVQFEGNDPSAFLAGQPLQTVLSPIYHGSQAITSSKHFHITGNLYVSQSIYAEEFHTNIVSSSIIFKEGDTVTGNSLDDIHITTGSFFITSSDVTNITTNYTIKRPQDDRIFTIKEGHITQSGDIRVDKPGTTTPCIIIRPSDTAGQVDIKNGNGDTVLVMDDGDRNLYFFDKGGEHIAGDGTDLTITAGTDINLTPGNAVLVDTDKQLRFRDTAIGINSSTDGQLDIKADGELELTSPIVDIDASTGLALDGANLNSDWTVNTTNKINFRDTGLSIYSAADGKLDIVADGDIRLNANITRITGSITGSEGIHVRGHVSSSGTIIADQMTYGTPGSGHVTLGASDGDILGYETDSSTNKAFQLSNHTAGGKLTLFNVNSAYTLLSYNAHSYLNNASIYNFGIGNASPGAKLDVTGNIRASTNITASGNISASGLLFFSASHVVRQADQSHQGVLVYDSGSGQVFMTGSYGGAAGGGGGTSANDVTITIAAGDGLKTGGDFTTNQSAGKTITLNFDASDVAGTGLEASGEDLRIAAAAAGNGLSGGGGSALALDLNELTDTAINTEDSIVFIDANDNGSKKETIADFVTTLAGDGIQNSSNKFAIDASDFAGTGLGASSENLQIETEKDGGLATHYVNFTDSQTGANQIKTSEYLTFNPGQQKFHVGKSVFLHGSGSVTASKNIWVSHSVGAASQSFVSASAGRYTHVTFSRNLSGSTPRSKITAMTGSFQILSASVISASYIGNGRGLTGIAVVAGDPTHVQFQNAAGEQDGEVGLRFLENPTNHLIVGSAAGGDTGNAAVTISNAFGEGGSADSPLMLAHVPRDSGRILLWNETHKKVVAGPTNIAGGDGGKGGGATGHTFFDTTIIARGFLIQASPAIYAASGSLTFYTGSKTGSRFGHMSTASAIFDMVHDKSGDQSSFIMSGSKNAKMYFSGSTSGKVGIGTTDPKNEVDIKADSFKIRSKDGTKEIEFGEEGQLRTRKFSNVGSGGAAETSGSELVLSFTPGTFDTPVRARAGDVMGSIRWEDESFGEEIRRKAATPMRIDGVVDASTVSGVSGHIAIFTGQSEAVDESPQERLRVGEEGVWISQSLKLQDGQVLSMGTTRDGIDRRILFNHTTQPFSMGIDDSQNKFVINDAASFATDSTLEISSTAFTIGTGHTLAVTEHAQILGGVHVGGSTDPGTDNLLVDGRSTFEGHITASGNISASGGITSSGVIASTGRYEFGYGSTAAYLQAEDIATLTSKFTNNNFNGKITASGNIRAGREGFLGSYAAGGGEVQGVWSIGQTVGGGTCYKINTSADNFGNHYGLGYAYNGNGGSVAGLKHQFVLVNNGTVGGALSFEGDASLRNITASSDISASGEVVTKEVSSGGNFILDVAGDITLDADGADIILSDAGTDFGRFKRDTSDFVIKSETNDKDILLKGVDNSSTITALKLDMSEAGSATFNSNITASGDVSASGVFEGDRKFKVPNTTIGNTGGADVVYFGAAETLIAGGIYYLNSSGEWAQANASAATTAAGMLAVAKGTTVAAGMVLRGMVTLVTDPGTIGDTIYLSNAATRAQASAPTGTGQVVRVIGYCVDSSNKQVYFNPDGTWVELT